MYLTAKQLVDVVLAYSERKHEYLKWTKEQHVSWALGFLASTVVEKSLNDSIVIDRMVSRLQDD